MSSDTLTKDKSNLLSVRLNIHSRHLYPQRTPRFKHSIIFLYFLYTDHFPFLIKWQTIISRKLKQHTSILNASIALRRIVFIDIILKIISKSTMMSISSPSSLKRSTSTSTAEVFSLLVKKCELFSFYEIVWAHL